MVRPPGFRVSSLDQAGGHSRDRLSIRFARSMRTTHGRTTSTLTHDLDWALITRMHYHTLHHGPRMHCDSYMVHSIGYTMTTLVISHVGTGHGTAYPPQRVETCHPPPWRWTRNAVTHDPRG